MFNASVMELETNLNFNVQIDKLPSEKQNYTIVYIDDKEVKRPTVTETYGTINFKIEQVTPKVDSFLVRWFKTKKRIDLMLETENCMFFLKGCSLKMFKASEETFTVFYNSFREA